MNINKHIDLQQLKLADLPNDISADKSVAYFTERAKTSNYPLLFVDINGLDYPVKVSDVEYDNDIEVNIYIYGLNTTINFVSKEYLSPIPKGAIFEDYLSNLVVLPFFENGKISQNKLLECAIQSIPDGCEEEYKGDYCIVCPSSGTYFTYDPSTQGYCTTVTNESVCADSLTVAAILAFEWAVFECDYALPK